MDACPKAGGCANGIPSACIYSSLAAVGGVAACAALSTSLRCTHEYILMHTRKHTILKTRAPFARVPVGQKVGNLNSNP
jgi:hypothetical protein